MNLPFVLDIVIGLVLIYLVLSFLSSEIQELITTLLQWRAAHLKKSIEILLSGSANSENIDGTLTKSRRILEEIYNNPLIKNISQESRGGIETELRRFARAIVTLGRKGNLTLKGNEPSYIPSETFATTLLEKLALSQLAHDLTALKLQVLIERDILSGIQTSLKTYLENEETQLSQATRSNLQRESDNLRITFNEIVAAFKAEKISLQTGVYRLKSELNNYILSTTTRIQSQADISSVDPPATDASMQQTDNPLLWQLVSLQRGIFYDDENADYDNIAEVIRRLQPTLAEILEVFKLDARNVYEQYESFANVYQEIRNKAQHIAQDLPLPVQQTLAVLARRAEINLARSQDQVELLQDELQQFKLEIQNWFDRSMDRASGVYKRNAKGVGFLIGLVIAIALNADTFHIVTRLTTDSTLREALVSSAEVISSQCNAPTQPNAVTPSPSVPAETPAPTSSPPQSPEDCITQVVERATALPIGWNQEQSSQQGVNVNSGMDESIVPLPLPLRKVLGWAVTGLAIAMGASFWFDLLGKVVNVRNAGKRPESKVDTNSSARSGNDR